MFIMYANMYNKINEAIIRINEAESKIDESLRCKFDLLDKITILVNKDKDINLTYQKKLNDIKKQELSNFEVDRYLVSIYNEFLKEYLSNMKLKNNVEVYKINKNIEEIDKSLSVLRKYYNKHITNYNSLINKFPTLIIAKIKNYQEKMFYDLKDMHDNNYEDFKI